MAEQSDNAPAKSHAVPESETELSTFAVEAIEPSFGLELVDTSVKPTDNSNISGRYLFHAEKKIFFQVLLPKSLQIIHYKCMFHCLCFY